MLKFIIRLVDRSGAADSEKDADQVHLATATLLIRAAVIDGHADEAEIAKLMQLLVDEFELDDAEATDLVATAISEEREAVDLFRYTNILNKALDPAGRSALIEMLWEVVYADGRLDDYESNLVWRVAELIGIDSSERIRLKQKVAQRSTRQS